MILGRCPVMSEIRTSGHMPRSAYSILMPFKAMIEQAVSRSCKNRRFAQTVPSRKSPPQRHSTRRGTSPMRSKMTTRPRPAPDGVAKTFVRGTAASSARGITVRSRVPLRDCLSSPRSGRPARPRLRSILGDVPFVISLRPRSTLWMADRWPLSTSMTVVIFASCRIEADLPEVVARKSH